MMHWKLHTVRINFEGDCEWDGIEGEMGSLFIKYKGGTWPYSAFEADAWELPVEDFKRTWGITNLQTLGRSYCKAGYTDRLHPEKSWYGKNLELLERLRKFQEELEREEANGSKP